tara:strand:+ start:64 stop:444 length:381 start_codon:yes stop_codon:yes gene_type:complete
MKYQDPVNTVQFEDEYAKNLMKMYENWMGGDTFQGTEMPSADTLAEEPFAGMSPQSNGAEIEDVTKKKKEIKKGAYLGKNETAPAEVQVEEEVEEREEYELNGETYVIEKIKGKGWQKGYKKSKGY